MTSRGTVHREQQYVYADCEYKECAEINALVYECGESLYCAEHTRWYAQDNPRPQLCDKCGSEQLVFRDPSHRRNEYLCWDCHVAAGTQVRDSVTGRMLRGKVTKVNLA